MECFLVVTVLWVFSVCLHEFGHAVVAYHGGDYTVREKGYLTLNPIHYTHPVFSLLLPVIFMMMGGIGLPGGAVYINHHLLRSRAWSTWVSLAGPAMNVVLVLVISLVFKTGLVPDDDRNLASISLGFLMQLQICSVFLCLLPVPPLDGFRAISPWLPEETSERLNAASTQGIILVYLALAFIKPVNHAFWDAVNHLCSVLGVDPYLGYVGLKVFRFWERPGL